MHTVNMKYYIKPYFYGQNTTSAAVVIGTLRNRKANAQSLASTGEK